MKIVEQTSVVINILYAENESIWESYSCVFSV